VLLSGVPSEDYEAAARELSIERLADAHRELVELTGEWVDDLAAATVAREQRLAARAKPAGLSGFVQRHLGVLEAEPPAEAPELLAACKRIAARAPELGVTGVVFTDGLPGEPDAASARRAAVARIEILARLLRGRLAAGERPKALVVLEEQARAKARAALPLQLALGEARRALREAPAILRPELQDRVLALTAELAAALHELAAIEAERRRAWAA